MTDERPLPDVTELVRANQDDERLHTDTGAGHLYVDLHRRLVRYAVDSGRWYVRCDGQWCPETDRAVRALALTTGVVRRWRDEAAGIDDERVREVALRTVAGFEGLGKRRAMLEVAATDPRIQCDTEDFDAVPHELATPGGVVDLDTGATRAVRPSDMHSRRTAVDYRPDARSDLLDEYLDTFLPDPEHQRFVFAVLGYCLRGGNPRRLLPVFWGDTTSGKSQLFAALHRGLGSYICTVGPSVFRGNLDDRPRPDLVLAMFTRIAYATEASKSWALHADQVKRLTGGDALPYRNLYAAVVNKVPRFTPVLVTNVMPRITNADVPTKRRVLVLPFDRSLDPRREDPRKKEAFLADPGTLEALLARVVAGARDDVIATPPERFVLATLGARGDVDHTDEFVEWAEDEGYLVTLPPDAPLTRCVRTSELHALYTHWLQKHGDLVDRADRLSLRGLTASLREKRWESQRSAGTRWVGRGLAPELPAWLRIVIDV